MTPASSLVAGERATRWVLMLHGILGSGVNWRSIARQFVAQRPEWGAVLVDLRMHGASQGFAAPHTIASAAADLDAVGAPGPITAVLGHSFGGKVAAEYARRHAAIEQLWTIDSNPGTRPGGTGSESTTRVVAMLRALPPRFATREEFVRQVVAHGTDRAMAQWLAMNLVPHAEGGLRSRLDLDAIDALLADYFAVDQWPLLEALTARVHLVIGGKRSSVYTEGDRTRAEALAATRANVEVDLIPEAGHWVHVDAPDALLALLVARA